MCEQSEQYLIYLTYDPLQDSPSHNIDYAASLSIAISASNGFPKLIQLDPCDLIRAGKRVALSRMLFLVGQMHSTLLYNKSVPISLLLVTAHSHPTAH